jgi:exopolysaccharide production protein ExoZ
MRPAKIVNVEAGRGVAAVLVVLYHCTRYYFGTPEYWAGPAFGGFFIFGNAGVEFFFVLSGYIMLTVHQADIGRPSRVGNYAQKRFDRIYPFFWLVLAVTVALYALMPNTGEAIYRNPANIAQSALLAGRDPWDAVVFVSWSMWHEVAFYAVFALIIAAPRLGLPLMAAWMVACLAVTAFGVQATPWPRYLTAYVNVLFAVGMATAVVAKRVQIKWPLTVLALGLGGFFGTGIGVWLDAGLSHSLTTTLYGLSSAAILVGAIQAEQRGLLKAPGWLVTVGAASYAIYLTHMLSLSVLAKLAAKVGLTSVVPAWLGFILLAVGATVAGVVIHLTVERRMMGLTRKLGEFQARRRGTVAA